MYVNDHEPPRIHARYGGRKVVLDIRTMKSCEAVSIRARPASSSSGHPCIEPS